MEQENKELSRNTIFILPKLFETDPWVIRVCLPGIDRGGAVYLEYEFGGTLEDAKALVIKIAEKLPTVRVDLEDIGSGY